MPEGSSGCHLCHIHDHAPGASLLRTHPLRASHSRSRNPSRSSTTPHPRAHHSHAHAHHSRDHDHARHSRESLREAEAKQAKVASALAKLSERSHSLPGSRGSTLSRANEVSVLPDGGDPHAHHRGQQDVHGSTRSRAEYNGVLAALLETRAASLPSNHGSVHREPDLLTTLPHTHNNSRTSTLSRGRDPHGSNLTLAQDTDQDYYMHVQRARYKDEARKQRFNLQTVMLIGCYTMLFVVAIIVGVVLCQQNGWLGFGHDKAEEASSTGNVPSRTETRNRSSMRDLDRSGRIRGSSNRGNRPGPTIDYDYSDDASPPRINTAGVFPAGTGVPLPGPSRGSRDPLRTLNFAPTDQTNPGVNGAPRRPPPRPNGSGQGQRTPPGSDIPRNRLGSAVNGNGAGGRATGNPVPDTNISPFVNTPLGTNTQTSGGTGKSFDTSRDRPNTAAPDGTRLAPGRDRDSGRSITGNPFIPFGSSGVPNNFNTGAGSTPNVNNPINGSPDLPSNNQGTINNGPGTNNQRNNIPGAVGSVPTIPSTSTNQRNFNPTLSGISNSAAADFNAGLSSNPSRPGGNLQVASINNGDSVNGPRQMIVDGTHGNGPRQMIVDGTHGNGPRQMIVDGTHGNGPRQMIVDGTHGNGPRQMIVDGTHGNGPRQMIVDGTHGNGPRQMIVDGTRGNSNNPSGNSNVIGFNGGVRNRLNPTNGNLNVGTGSSTANGPAGSFNTGTGSSTESRPTGSFNAGTGSTANDPEGSFNAGASSTANGPGGSFNAGTGSTANGPVGSFNAGTGNTGSRPAGSFSAGTGNTGSRPAGSFNAGTDSTANGPVGSFNAGTGNSASRPAGSFNAGTDSTANGPVGSFNAGTGNSASRPAGSFNAGTDSTANGPVGSFNAGTGNSASRPAGSFNAGTGSTANSPGGSFNAGTGNSASRPAGSFNAGTGSTANGPAGSFNAGTGNTGSRPAGSFNAGASGTGIRPTGSFNAGTGNTASRPAGSFNAGTGNTASRPAGSFNAGTGGTGIRPTGSFNAGTGSTANGPAGSSNTGTGETGIRPGRKFNGGASSTANGPRGNFNGGSGNIINSAGGNFNTGTNNRANSPVASGIPVTGVFAVSPGGNFDFGTGTLGGSPTAGTISTGTDSKSNRPTGSFNRAAGSTRNGPSGSFNSGAGNRGENTGGISPTGSGSNQKFNTEMEATSNTPAGDFNNGRGSSLNSGDSITSTSPRSGSSMASNVQPNNFAGNGARTTSRGSMRGFAGNVRSRNSQGVAQGTQNGRGGIRNLGNGNKRLGQGNTQTDTQDLPRNTATSRVIQTGRTNGNNQNLGSSIQNRDGQTSGQSGTTMATGARNVNTQTMMGGSQTAVLTSPEVTPSQIEGPRGTDSTGQATVAHNWEGLRKTGRTSQSATGSRTQQRGRARAGSSTVNGEAMSSTRGVPRTLSTGGTTGARRPMSRTGTVDRGAGRGSPGRPMNPSQAAARDATAGMTIIPPPGGHDTPVKVLGGITVQRGKVVALSTITSDNPNIAILQPDHDVIFHITPSSPDAGVSLIRPSKTPPMSSQPARQPEPGPRRNGELMRSRNMRRQRLRNSTVLRRWEHMDQEGTLSRGLVRSDGSFAFTNCRPPDVCGLDDDSGS